MKKNFAEPEMEAVRFNAQDLIATASGGGCTGECQVDNDGCPMESELIGGCPVLS